MSAPATTVLFRRIRRRLHRNRLRALAREISRRVAAGRAFTCLVTGDAELRRLNRDFLGRDYPTDVLAFPSRVAQASAGSGGLQPAVSAEFLGDLAISLPRAAAQARRFGHSLEDEIAILMLHGLLHLMGFDHERDGGRMTRLEARWRRALSLPAGLTARGSP